MKVEQTGAGGSGTAVQLQVNEYNGLHWRIYGVDTVKIGSPVKTKRFMYFSAAWQLLQIDSDDDPDTSAGLNRRTQITWGARYIDDAVAIRTDPDLTGWDPLYSYHYLTDAQFSVVCLLDEVGRLAERVGYTPYGVARHHWFDDIDGDGDADGDDHAIWKTLQDVPITDSTYNVDADLNRDGEINSGDPDVVEKPALPEGILSDRFVSGEGGNQWGVPGPESPIGYDGYVFNASTMQYTVRFRHYAPGLGRWAKRDPLGYPDDGNSYAAVACKPVQLTDPTGLSPQFWTFGGINHLKEYVAVDCQKADSTIPSPDLAIISQLGSTDDYIGRTAPNIDGLPDAAYVAGIRSQELLNGEADRLARDFKGKACCRADGRKTDIRLIMIAPKTQRIPSKTPCCNISITVYYSPYDGVPNQGLYTRGGYGDPDWWQSHYDDVRVVDTRVVTGTVDPSVIGQRLWGAKCPNHAVAPYLGSLPILEPLSTEPGDERRRMLISSGSRSGGALNSIKAALNDSYDIVATCHSQGCNNAMAIIQSMCTP